MPAESADEPTTDASPDYRQFALVVLAALALVLAAFLAPAIASQGQSASSPDADPGERELEAEGDPDGELDPDAVPDVSIDWRKLLDWFDFSDPPPEPNDDDSERPACRIYLSDDPIPGSEVTARIEYRGEPVDGVPVWFNDRRVGETDDLGRVTGEVPYVEELVVRIDTDAHPGCTAVEDTTRGTATVTASSPLPATAIATATPAATSRPQPRDGASENGTVEYEVDGAVEIGLHGDPDPGATVTVVATIEGVPMREAAVTVDGDRVATTDDDGTAAIEVPDDGSESFELGVARGDFAGATTVDIRLLEASLAPEGIAPIPGSPGVLEATVGDEPAEDADVYLGDEVLGTTDADGRLELSLPRDPTATVTVETGDRRTTVSLLDEYGALALVVSLAVAGAAAVSYRTHGRRGPLAVLGATAALVAVLTVEAFYGPIAGALALLAVVAIVALVGWLRTGPSVPAARPTTGDAPGRFVEWLVARLLALVAVLERWLERGRSLVAAVRAWLGGLPRSASALWARLTDWLETIPERVRGRLNRALAALRRSLAARRRLDPTTVAASLATVPIVAGGYVVDGRRGAVLASLALAAAGVFYWYRSDDPTETETDADRETGPPEADDTGSETDRGESDRRRSLRELWRAFARRVAPRRWPRRTPGEIRRAALEQGYPRRPATELTTLFREVEYGGRPLSNGLRDRADEAYAELVGAEAEGDPAARRTAGAESTGEERDATTRDDEIAGDDETETGSEAESGGESP